MNRYGALAPRSVSLKLMSRAALACAVFVLSARWISRLAAAALNLRGSDPILRLRAESDAVMSTLLKSRANNRSEGS
jgi:hypothetical protein